MDIKLQKLRIKNFQGLKNFVLNVNGKNASLYGDNACGKTTTFNAFLWLLFGKDNTDRERFKFKPQDAQGNDIHMLQTEVEVELLIDGKPLKLKKMSKEKWVKKHDAEDKRLDGNTISYWWDEVPGIKEGEYKQKISELIDENIFRMITNPMYFNTKVEWKDRRKILFEICGDMSDAEIIASDKKLTKLTEILSGKSIEDYKKILAERIKNLMKERDDISPRIDELFLSLPQAQPDYLAAGTELQAYKDMLAVIEIDMTNATNAANAYRKKQQESYGLKGKLDKIKTRIDTECNADRKKLIDEKNRLDGEKYRIESDVNNYKTRIEQNEKLIENNSIERQKLLAEWKELNEKKVAQDTLQFIDELDENNFICPTCGQSLPDDVKDGKLNEMRVSFENNKKSDIAHIENLLEKNKILGLGLKHSTEILQKAIDDYATKLAEAVTILNEIENRLMDIDIVLSEPVDVPDYNEDSEYSLLQKQITDMQDELDKPVEDTTSTLLQNKREVQEKIDTCNKILNNKTVAENTRQRIEDLKAEEKRIAGLITELEGHKYLLEQFIFTKVNLLESNINSRFKYVRFKMFDVQINGGISECCEAMVNTNGCYVPFADANHAGRVNAGLDIINTLCAYYGVTTPIFIDFAESVSNLIETNSQIIGLVKPETFVKLDKVLQDSLIEKHGSYEAAKKFWNDRNKMLRVEVRE